jgi:transcriptional regulator with XRE-family HTH domain
MSDQPRDEQFFSSVRSLCNEGYTQKEVAAKFDISRSYVSDIVCGRAGWCPDDDALAVIQGLKDDRAFARKRLREALKAEVLFKEAAKVATQNIKPLRAKAAPKFKKREGAIDETAVLVLSDGHHDQVVSSDSVGGIEEYNFDISCRRAEVLVDAVIKFCTNTLVGYNFNKLVILSLGDSTSGEIHDAEKRSAFGNQFKNALAIGALHGLMVNDLASHFPEIEVHCVSGNHGRRTHSKEYTGPQNNWDYMVSKIAAAHTSSLGSVSWNIPDSFDAVVDIEGHGFHISHGDDIANTSGNPWQGLRKRHERQIAIHRGTRSNPNKSFLSGEELDYHVIGHHHTRGIVNGNGVGYICNGAWLATDPYAYQKLGVAGPPEQLLFGVNADRGATWQLPITLYGKDTAKECRYDVIKDSVIG